MSLLDLAAKISLDTSEYENGLDNAEGEATSFGSKLKDGIGTAAAGTAKALASVGKAAFNAVGDISAQASATAAAGDHIDKMSQKIGISAEAYQEWAFVMEHSGASVDSLQTGMKTLSTQIVKSRDDMANISDASEWAQTSFGKLGISMEEVSNMSNEDLLARTIEGLQGMEEGAERTKLATELLGRAGNDLGALFNTSAEETQAMKEQVKELGGVLSDDAVKAAAKYQDTMQNMNVALDGIKNNLSAEFLPGITSVMEGVTALISGDASGIDKIQEGIDNFIAGIQKNLPKIIEAAKKIIPAILKGITKMLPEILKAAVDIIKELLKGIVDMLPEIIDAGIELIVSLAEGIGEALPELIPKIVDAIILICEKLTEPDSIEKLIHAALEIVLGLVKGLMRALPKLVEAAPQIIMNIIKGIIQSLPEIFAAAGQIIGELIGGLENSLGGLLTEGKKIFDDFVGVFADAAKALWDAGGEFIAGLWDGISEALGEFWKNIKGFFEDVIKACKEFFKTVWDYATDIVDAVGFAFSGESADLKVNAAGWKANAEYNENIKEAINRSKELEKEGLVRMEQQGDIVIPVYLGTDKVDEMVVKAWADYRLKQGGMS